MRETEIRVSQGIFWHNSGSNWTKLRNEFYSWRKV